tara:strand:+ start:340 stop:789 length:450 start_codon:yes stop_codon:yes gene_type:complete
VPESKFNELNYTFTINSVDKISDELRKEFKETLSLIDKKLIDYYFNLNHNISKSYIIKLDEWEIGYGLLVEDDEYFNLYEIYIKKEFRELGLGTKLFNYINNEIKEKNKKVRTYTLPSDRTAKNFYESNRITARVLIMEEKRENSRYRP